MLETQLYPLRWLILVVIAVLQVMCAFSFSYGQVNNVYVAYFNVSYETVDWMMNSAFLGSSLVSPLLIWASGNGVLKFRRLLIIGSGCVMFCYLLNGLAARYRHIFSLALIGQIAIGVAIVVMDTITGVFAVQWFPNHQVGTAIGVSLMGFYGGGIISSFLFTNLLKPPFSGVNESNADSNFTAALVSDSWISSIAHKFIAIDFSCFAMSVIILLFVCVFVSDTPPLPPTIAQALKRQLQEGDVLKPKPTILKQTKYLFTDKVYLDLTFFFTVTLLTFDLQLAFLGEIVRRFANDLGKIVDPDVLSGYLIVLNSAGSLLGNFVAGRVIDKTDRHLLMTRIASGCAFCASLSLFVGFRYALPGVLLAGNSLLGLFTGFCLVGVFELVTQHTYPADETFVTLWMIAVDSFVGLVLIVFGRFMLSSLGPYGALGTISGLLLASALTICFTKPLDKRRLAEEQSLDDEQTHLIQDNLKIDHMTHG